MEAGSPEETINIDYKQVFRYFPYIFGVLGILLIGFGLYFTFQDQDKQEITFSEEEKPFKNQKIMVDIAGAVENPGVYEFSAEGRYQEALLKAGGLSLEADREYVDKYVNLAAKLSDGLKIYIPKVSVEEKGEQKGSIENQKTEEEEKSGLININTSSLANLDTLSGVGPVTAQKIIDNRSYQRIEELLEKKIVGASVWEKIKGKICVF